MDEDCWGTGGWHFRETTFEDIPIKLRQWRDDDGTMLEVKGAVKEELIRTYVGKPVAFQRCPAYWGTIERLRRSDYDIAG